MSSVTEKYGKNLLNPLATNTNSADYKINELNNAINKFQKNASVTNDAAIIADLSVDVANKLENAKNYISDDVYKNIQNQLISYRSASNQQRINQEIRQNLIAKNKALRASAANEIESAAKSKMATDSATSLDLLELLQLEQQGVKADKTVLSDMQKHLLGQETSNPLYTQMPSLPEDSIERIEKIYTIPSNPKDKTSFSKEAITFIDDSIKWLESEIDRIYEGIELGGTLTEENKKQIAELSQEISDLKNYKKYKFAIETKKQAKLLSYDISHLSYEERLAEYDKAVQSGDELYADYIDKHKYDGLSYNKLLEIEEQLKEKATPKVPDGYDGYIVVSKNELKALGVRGEKLEPTPAQKELDDFQRNVLYYAKHEYELEKLGIHGEEYVKFIKENEDAKILDIGDRWGSKNKIREIEKEWISRGIMTQDEINDLKQYIKDQYQKEKNEAEMKELYSDVTEYNDLQELGITIGSSPVAFGGNVLTLFDSIYQAGRESFGGEKRPMNAYSDINASAQWAKTVREAVQADQSDAGKFFYGVGCSLLDMYMSIAASGGIGDSLAKSVTGKAVVGSLTKNVTLASMSLNAGGGAALDAMEKTSNPYEVAAIGVSSAVFEALAEKLPLDNLFKIAGQEGKITTSMILEAMGSQAVSEFGEEAATETANIIMEAIVMGDKSDWAQTVQDYIDKGYSESEARSKALVSMVGRIGMSGLAGAISGGFSGGGASTINYLAYNYSLNSTGNTLIKNNQVERLIELAETSGIDISAYNLEGKKGNYNAKAIGELYFELMRNKSDAVSNALKEMGVSEADIAVVQSAVFREAFGQELSTEMQAKYNQYEDVIDNAMNDEASSLNVAANDYMLTSLLVEIPRSNASNTATDVSGTDSADVDFDTNIDADIDTEVNVESSSDIDTITESEIAEADYLDNETLESVEENEYDKTIRLMDGRAKPLTEAQAYVQSVGRALGYTVVIDDLSRGGRTASGKSFKGTTRGFFDGQTIYLHEGQTTFDAVVEIFKHEITHYAELNPEMYNKYAKAVFDSKVFENWISGKAKGRSHPARLGQYRQSIIDIYEANGKTLDPTAADLEIIANFTSEMLFNEKGNTLERFINEVNSEDRNAISRFIHDFISWLKARLKGEKVSLKIVKLENRFAAVLRNVDNTNAQKNNTTNDGDVQYDGEGNSYSFGDNERYAEYDKPITIDDIRLLREIGRKSINEFTPQEIKIAQKWAYKFYQQLGTKSPFFRRWFGDWRAYDKTPVVIVDVPSMEFNSQEFKDFVLSQRGNVVNNDTKTTDKAGWTIRISGEGQRNTISHSGGKRLSAKGLTAIQKLIENAVLLDSEVHEHHSNNSKSENTDRITFDHRLYSLGKNSDGSIALYRITVEEIFKNQKQPDDMRFHNLKYIEKVADNIGSLTADKQHAESASDVSTTNYSVCDLYGFVKEFDADFTAGETVSRSQLNEDGTPKVFYHQTAGEFTEFDIARKGAGSSDNETPFGIFLKETDKDIGLKGKRQMPLFAKMNNPLIVENRETLVYKAIQLSKEYENYYNKSKQIDMEYSKKHEDAAKAFNDFIIENSKSDNRKSRQELYNDSEFQRLFYAEDQIVEEWQKVNRENDLKAKEALTLALKNNNYDGVILKKDVGSFGRVTEAYIVFDKTQVKSAADGGNIGTFSEAENDIRYSFEDDVVDKTSSLAERVRLGEISQTEYLNELQSLMNEATEKYGAIPKGENPKVDVTVPRQVSDKRNTRRFVRTVLESGTLTDEMVADTDEAILKDALSYVPISNEEAIKVAAKSLKNGTAERDWNKVANGDKIPSKHDIAKGEILLKMYAENGDARKVMELVADLSEVATRAGQTVQAFSLLKKMSGVGQLYYIQKTVDKLNRDLEKKHKGKHEQITIDETLAGQLVTAKPGTETENIVDEIMQDIAEQVPVTFLDKWNAWRYLAMLGNPRTHIRNLLGNAVFMPAIKLKDTIKAGMEKAFVSQENRTTSVIVNKEYKDFAESDFEKVVDIITGNGKMNPSDAIREQQKIFKNKVLEGFRKFNFDALEKEDMIFLKMHYKRALGGFLQARNIDLNNVDEATLNEARNYAIEEAQKATYRDASAFANTISRFSRSNKVANLLVEGILPFKKTPINIVKRGIEYSPIGLLKTLSKGAYDLKKGNITASQFIDGISSGLTGTGVFVLGVILSNLGIAIGGLGYDDEDALKRLNGEQEYSIELFGHSYTVDWMAPVCIPFFMGVEFANTFTDNEKDIVTAFVDSAYSSLEPVINLSMLNGIRDTIAAARYSDAEDVLTQVGGETISSYFSQALPTLFGQVARTFDDTRRSNFVPGDATGFEKKLYEFFQNAMGKTPILENQKMPYTDAFGEKDTNDNFFLRVFENMLSPGYSSTIKETDVNAELADLFKQTGDGAVIPRKASKSFTVGKKRIYLDADQYTQYNTKKGQLSQNMLVDLFNSKGYKSMTYTKKAEAVSEVYKYANALAKTEVSDYKLKGKYAKWKEYQGYVYDVSELIALDVTDKDFDGSGRVSKSEYAEAVNNTDMSQQQKDLLIGLNKAEGKSDYSKNNTKGFGVGDWYYKKNKQYVKITSAAELNRLRRNNVDTYVYTGNYTDVIDELWRAYRGY